MKHSGAPSPTTSPKTHPPRTSPSRPKARRNAVQAPPSKAQFAKAQRSPSPARQPQTPSLAQTVTAYLESARSRLAQLDLPVLARQTGFLRRLPRKIDPGSFLLGLLGLSAETVLSLERLAAGIALAAQTSYTKQALHKRLGPGLEQFVAKAAVAFFGQWVGQQAPERLRHFQRVLLHDSTVESVPKRLAHAYPGGRNQKPCQRAALKVQFIGDLLNGTVLHWSLSGYTRNDQAAAPDILSVLRPGDLIIRDLGYFVLRVFQQLDRLGAYFLSRYRHGVTLFDLAGQRWDLRGQLRRYGRLDCQVLMGPEKVPVRLVAVPVPQALASARRRQARANHDGRSQPTPAHLFLLGWNIHITNVPSQLWSPKDIAAIYRLRWRVEIVFKAWKSYLGLHRLNTRTGPLLGLSAAVKLLFCVLVHHQCHALELLGDGTRQVSLLRLARIFEQCSCWMMAAILHLSPKLLLEHHLAHHLFYDRRADRKNFFQLLADLNHA